MRVQDWDADRRGCDRDLRGLRPPQVAHRHDFKSGHASATRVQGPDVVRRGCNRDLRGHQRPDRGTATRTASPGDEAGPVGRIPNRKPPMPEFSIKLARSRRSALSIKLEHESVDSRKLVYADATSTLVWSKKFPYRCRTAFASSVGDVRRTRRRASRDLIVDVDRSSESRQACSPRLANWHASASPSPPTDRSARETTTRSPPRDSSVPGGLRLEDFFTRRRAGKLQKDDL